MYLETPRSPQTRVRTLLTSPRPLQVTVHIPTVLIPSIRNLSDAQAAETVRSVGQLPDAGPALAGLVNCVLAAVRGLPDAPVEFVAGLHLHLGDVADVSSDDEVLDEAADDEGDPHPEEEEEDRPFDQPDENAAANPAGLPSAPEHGRTLPQDIDRLCDVTFIPSRQYAPTAHNIAAGRILICILGIGDRT